MSVWGVIGVSGQRKAVLSFSCCIEGFFPHLVTEGSEYGLFGFNRPTNVTSRVSGEAEYVVVLLFSESDGCEGVLKVRDKLDIKPGCRFYGNLYVLLQSIVMDIKSRLMASDNTFGQ